MVDIENQQFSHIFATSVARRRRSRNSYKFYQDGAQVETVTNSNSLWEWMRGTHNFTIGTISSIENALGTPILQVASV